MKYLISLLTVFISFSGITYAASSNTGHGNVFPFTVEAGNTCYGLGAYVIGPKCGGPDKIYYIGPDSKMEQKGWCQYVNGSWTGTLTTGQQGYYACITSAR